MGSRDTMISTRRLLVYGKRKVDAKEGDYYQHDSEGKIYPVSIAPVVYPRH
jgi:hypothetical protein